MEILSIYLLHLVWVFLNDRRHHILRIFRHFVRTEPGLKSRGIWMRNELTGWLVIWIDWLNALIPGNHHRTAHCHSNEREGSSGRIVGISKGKPFLVDPWGVHEPSLHKSQQWWLGRWKQLRLSSLSTGWKNKVWNENKTNQFVVSKELKLKWRSFRCLVVILSTNSQVSCSIAKSIIYYYKYLHLLDPDNGISVEIRRQLIIDRD